jgi:hypothetical protein
MMVILAEICLALTAANCHQLVVHARPGHRAELKPIFSERAHSPAAGAWQNCLYVAYSWVVSREPVYTSIIAGSRPSDGDPNGLNDKLILPKQQLLKVSVPKIVHIMKEFDLQSSSIQRPRQFSKARQLNFTKLGKFADQSFVIQLMAARCMMSSSGFSVRLPIAAASILV